MRVSARHDSGLIGPLALAWDAARGTPLRVALYPRGSSTAAVALQVTHIAYGTLPADATALRLPAGTEVTRVHLPSKAELRHAVARARAGTHSSAAAVSPAAPATLAGLPRTVARTFSSPKGGGLIARYGSGLGSVLVIERPGGGSMPASAGVTVHGVRATELETTLGTIVSFQRGGTAYVVLGAQPASTILAVARALP